MFRSLNRDCKWKESKWAVESFNKVNYLYLWTLWLQPESAFIITSYVQTMHAYFRNLCEELWLIFTCP